MKIKLLLTLACFRLLRYFKLISMSMGVSLLEKINFDLIMRDTFMIHVGSCILQTNTTVYLKVDFCIIIKSCSEWVTFILLSVDFKRCIRSEGTVGLYHLYWTNTEYLY